MSHGIALPWLLLSLAVSAPGAPGAPATPAAAPALSEYETLRRDFKNLYDSLVAAQGIKAGDKATIELLRQRAAALDAKHPDDPAGLAIELQLSLWLGDQDAADTLYGRLTTLTKDPKYGLGWAQHFQSAGDRRRVGEIYERLVKLFPDDPKVRFNWAEFYREANQYQRAIDVLEDAKLDPAKEPAASVLMSECLFAEQRFPEALAALQAIPQEALTANPAIAGRVSELLAEQADLAAQWEQEQQVRSAEARAGDLPRVEIDLPEGRIVLELFENEAPNTVANFISLAEAGFYDGTKFHRIVPNLMIEGGDPNTKSGATGVPGSGGPGYRIADEYSREGARKHFAGSVAMSTSGTPDSAGSRFYITFVPAPQLNGKNTVFGRVVEGLDLVRTLQADDAIENVTVQRKRQHEYKPAMITEPAAPAPAPAPMPSLPPAPAAPPH